MPQRYLQGPIGNYRVVYVGNGQLERDLVPSDRTNHTISLQQDTEYDVFVDVSTTVGFNSSAEGNTINIPAFSSGECLNFTHLDLKLNYAGNLLCC